MLTSVDQILDIKSKTTYAKVPIIGFAGFSGSGKTTLIEKVIQYLKKAGLTMAVIKHSHHNIDLDKPGKDSHRLRQAGAQQLALTGPKCIHHFIEREQKYETSLAEALQCLSLDNIDLVIVEGFRHEAFSKIEVQRLELQKPLLCTKDPHIIALASDEANIDSPVPLLDLNNGEQVSQFILKHLTQSR